MLYWAIVCLIVAVIAGVQPQGLRKFCSLSFWFCWSFHWWPTRFEARGQNLSNLHVSSGGTLIYRVVGDCIIIIDMSSQMSS